MKKVAVLLYPWFSNYEMSVALSVLFQAEKPYDLITLKSGPVTSEEGLPVLCPLGVADADPGAYDCLLLTGCLNPPEGFMADAGYLAFVRRFAAPFAAGKLVLAAMSSAPILAAQAGMLAGRRYTCGVPEDFMDEVGRFDKDLMTTEQRVVRDGNLLTARGSGFVDFGITLGRMLGLEFSPSWYGAG